MTIIRSLSSLFRSLPVCTAANRFYATAQISSKINMDTKTSIRPKGILRNWDLRQCTLEDLEEAYKTSIEAIKKTGEEVASAESLTYDSILKPILDCSLLYAGRGTHSSVFTVAPDVALSEEIRSACTRYKGLISEAFVNLDMRKDVFDKLVEYRREIAANSEQEQKLTPELLRCLDKLIRNGRRAGLEGTEDVQAKVKALKNRMTDLCLEFSKRYNEENTLLQFDESELKGMDSEFLANLKKDPTTGKTIVSLKYPDYVPLMKKCTVPETRRRLETAYNSRCSPENNDVLRKLILARAEHAKLLGHPSHAAYVQEVLMAKNPGSVESFFNNLLPKISKHWEVEKAEMLKIKEKECHDLGLSYDGKINAWDFSRYFHLMNQDKFSLDADLLKQYFPLEVVLEGMLAIYQQLLGLKFTLVPNAEVWDSEVTVYQVEDTATGDLLGYFYLDLYPRPGKHGHACCVTLQQGCLSAAGERMKVAVLLICNFPAPSPDQPSLLSHDEVETMFHEFGHAMHHMCCKAETPLFFGTYVERDFVEAPSQMLENWCYEKESLRLMSKHYKTGEPLPDDLIKSLIKSKAKEGGAMSLRQIVYAMTDQKLHTRQFSENFEPLDTYKETLKELMGLEVTPGTNPLASFGHLAGGYDAQYYGYMWSNVYGEDMFESVFERDGVLSPEAGKRYRSFILAPGGSLDGMDMLKNFLGREPSLTPFLRSKGLL